MTSRRSRSLVNRNSTREGSTRWLNLKSGARSSMISRKLRSRKVMRQVVSTNACIINIITRELVFNNNKYQRKEEVHIKEPNTEFCKTPNVSQPTKGAPSAPTFLMSHQTLPCTNLNPFPNQSRCSARHPRASQRRSSIDLSLQIGTSMVPSVSRYQPPTSLKLTTPWMT